MVDEALERAVQGVCDVPLHVSWGLSVESLGNGAATIAVPVTDAIGNNAGVVHGGVLYSLLDIACYVASLTALPEGQNATSVSMSAQVLRARPGASSLRVEGRVEKAGRTLYFCEARAFADDELVATGTVTKAVIPSR